MKQAIIRVFDIGGLIDATDVRYRWFGYDSGIQINITPMTAADGNTLTLREYIGFKEQGRSETWKRSSTENISH